MTEKQQENTSASVQLQTLFNNYWEFVLQEHPQLATSVGDHRFDDKLVSVSEDDINRRHDACKRFLNRLKGIDRDALSTDEQLNYDIFRRFREEAIESYGFRSYLMPLSKISGFHMGFPQLYEHVPLNTSEDYSNYIARLNGFEKLTEQYIDLMNLGMREGYMPSFVALNGIEETIEPHIVEDAEKSLLFKPFTKFPKMIEEAERKRLIEEGREAITGSVVPGYRKLLKFLSEEYVAAARQDIAVSSLPNGKAYYRHLVRSYTTMDISPQDVHDIGLQEVKRIRLEMEAVIEKVDFKGGFEEFTEFMRTDEKFYPKTAEELLKVAAYIMKKMEGELPKLFNTLPRTPCGVKPIPDYAAKRATTAYYSPAPGDRTRAAFYYVNTYDLKSRPLTEMETLSFHEAVPGHHLQIALQQELENIPEFRKYGWLGSFLEGWALYAEKLGLEVGFFEDPYSYFGHLSHEIWRACRLVVDTGIHYFGWTREQAVDFMTENTGLTLLNINNEVDRYIAWPGQALSYKIGGLRFNKLRRYAEEELGERFNIREFHDVLLLKGAVPLDVLEERVRKWVAAQDGGKS